MCPVGMLEPLGSSYRSDNPYATITATVVAIEPVFASAVANAQRRVRHFRLTVQWSSSGPGGQTVTEVIEAKRVVVATGSTSCPRLPEWMQELRIARFFSQEEPSLHPPHSLRHAWELPNDLIIAGDGCGRPLHSQERILVVGGGLTAVQLATLAAERGCREVCLALRRPLRVQQFDFGAAWMDRRERPRLLRTFLASDFAARLRMLQEARGVSSVPPEAHAVLREMEEAGRLEVQESTEVSPVSPPVWDARAGCWRVVLETYNATAQRTARTERRFERIWCATGSDIRLDHHPLLGPLWERCPIRAAGGLPCLTPHLAWSEDCELYVLGAPASLCLGPDGGNLMGARTGAVRAGYVLGAALAGEGMVAQAKQEIAALQFRYDSKRQYVKGAGLGSGLVVAMAAEGAGADGIFARRRRRAMPRKERGCGCGC